MNEQATQLKRHKNLGCFLKDNEGDSRGGEESLTSYRGEHLHYIQVEGHGKKHSINGRPALVWEDLYTMLQGLSLKI